jgi:hypothetical protein
MIKNLIFFNVFAVPILLFFHIKGECSFIQKYLVNSTIPVCDYITNFWLNLLFAQLFFVVIMAFSYANIFKESEQKYPQYRPKPYSRKPH